VLVVLFMLLVVLDSGGAELSVLVDLVVLDSVVFL
jgi:hypothetical protein